MSHPPIFDSTALTIAGDAAYDAQGDAVDGSSVKIEPSAGVIAQGAMRPGRQVGAQHLNWLLAQFAGIMSGLITNDDAHEIELLAHTGELGDHQTALDLIFAWINTHSPRIKIVEFLTTSTFVVPPRCVGAMAFGCGGGGAGGTGSTGDTATPDDTWIAGGAGGGASLPCLVPLYGLTPGTTLDVIIGAGGLWGGSQGSTGHDGADSVIAFGATILAQFPGAQGGRGAVGTKIPSTQIHYTMGGMAVRGTPLMLIGPAGQGIRFDYFAGAIFGPGGQTIYVPMQPGQGGFGAGGSTLPVSQPGSRNIFGGHNPGAGGVKGYDLDATIGGSLTPQPRGGGGGGGGAAGAFGPGGAGGSGSHVIVQGSIPGAGGANSGAGGGGSGSVNSIAVGGPTPRNAASGGSGRVYIICVLESP